MIAEPLIHSAPSLPSAAPASPGWERVIERLGQALHRYGCPSHRVEAAMVSIAERLGLRSQIFSTPTAIFAAFQDGDEQRTILLRLQPGGVDLEKLVELDRLLEAVVAGSLSPREALAAIDEVEARQPRFGAPLYCLAAALTSAGAAFFFGGGPLDMLAAGLLSALVAALSLRVQRSPAAGQLFEPAAAFAVSASAGLAALAAGGLLTPQLVTLAALIFLVPGLGVTVAMTELAARSLVSGTARLAGAVLVFLTLGFGAALGSHAVSEILGTAPAAVPTSLPLWVELAALLITPLAFAVLFNAHPREIPGILVVGVATFYAGRAGSLALGAELGAFAGAILLGLTSNLYARLSKRPAAVTQIPGLMMLVPGSIGFRSVAALMEHDALSGVQAAFSVALVGIALATGLLIANLLLPPRGAV